MTGEEDVTLVGEQLEGLVDVLAPHQGVADLRPAKRVDVVLIRGAVLGHAEGTLVGHENVHLGRGLGTGRDLEDEANAVNDQLFTGGGDLVRGRHERNARKTGHPLAEARVDVTLGVFGEQHAVHIHGAADHDRAGQDVLADRRVEETLGRDHRHAGARSVVIAQYAADPAEVIGVAVGVDHGAHRSFTEVLVHQVQGRPGGLFGGEGIDDDPSGLARNEGDVRDVHASNLED